MELISLSLDRPEDIFLAAAALRSMAESRGVDAENRSRLLAAAIHASSKQASTGSSRLILHEGSKGTLDLFWGTGQDAEDRCLASVPSPLTESTAGDTSGDFAAFALDVAEGLNSAPIVASKQAMIETLERELEETNHGVMALYAELEDRAEKLRRADELKSRFLSYASHELRTPLNGISGLVRLLLSSGGERPPEEIKQLNFIHRAAEDLREIVNDLLDLAKVEAGKITVQASEFSLDFVFGALRGMFRPLLANDDVVLVFADTSAVPAIYSDEAKVAQILRNFISNALKFTEKGQVRVWAELAGDTVQISVCDTGIGIAQDKLAHVFEEFTQIDSPLQRRAQGTGLGLPLCSKLAELLGGRIAVSSQLGVGSTFTVILPLRLPHAVAASDSLLVVKKGQFPTKILVVDDVEIDRYLLTQLIGTAGKYEVIYREDGKAGLEAARQELPDLIFLDLSLPVMHGFDVLSALIAHSATQAIPVYAVTAEKLNEEQTTRLRSLTQGILFKEDVSRARRMKIDLSATEKVAIF